MLIAPQRVASTGSGRTCVSCVGSRGLYFRALFSGRRKGNREGATLTIGVNVRWLPLSCLSFAVLLSDLKTISLIHLFLFNKRSHVLSFNNPGYSPFLGLALLFGH